MIKFKFNTNLVNGLGNILSTEGIRKATEVAIDYYNWYRNKHGTAPKDFYCSFHAEEQYFKEGTGYYEAQFVYEVLPYLFTFSVEVKDLIFIEGGEVEANKAYDFHEFFAKDLDKVECAVAFLMFDYGREVKHFTRTDLWVGTVMFDIDGEPYIHVNNDLDVFEQDNYEDCKIMVPSREYLMKD